MQLAATPPYGLDKVALSEYKGVRPPFDRWEHVADVCGKLSDWLLTGCEKLFHVDTSPAAQQAKTQIGAWRKIRATGQKTPPTKLPGLDT